MESILVHPKNAKQSKALKDFLTTSKISFEIQEDVLPPHVIEGIKRGMEQARNGQTISLQEFKEKHLSSKSR